MKSKLPLFLIPILLSLLFIGTAYYINTHIIYPATTIYDWLDTVYLYHLANRLCILAILILLLQALYFSFKKNRNFSHSYGSLQILVNPRIPVITIPF